VPAEPLPPSGLSGHSGAKQRAASAGRAWPLLVALPVLPHLGGLWLARDLRAHVYAQLGLWLLAGALWLLALWALRQAAPLALGTPAERRALGLVWAVALLLRVPALLLPVGHSDDVYRYLWDGAVQQAGHSPYAGPPDSPEYADVRAARPELPARINHRELPTVYPPVAQLLFRLPAALADGAWELGAVLRRWKLVVVAADLLVLALLGGLCRGAGRDRRWTMVWGAAPLPAVELAYNGHLESLGVLPLLLALRLWQRAGWGLPDVGERGRRRLRALGRAVLIGALGGLAVLVKPVAGVLLPAALRLPRRTLLAMALGALLAMMLAGLPYGRRGALPPSLGEYGRRWRSNEGAFAVLQVVTEGAVRLVYWPPYYKPWRLPTLARAVTGRPRDTVWPDELAGALARGAVLLALGWLAWQGLRRRLAPPQLALGLLLGYQLLTPVLHPWYELWPLALSVLWLRLLPPIALMAALAPLAYLPLPGYFAGLGFHEAVWPRLMQHGAGWLALLVALRRMPQLLGPKAPSAPLPANVEPGVPGGDCC
jgi:hypothetical protein